MRGAKAGSEASSRRGKPHQRAQGDLPLRPGQGRPQAVVDAAAEGGVLVGALAGHVHRIGVLAPAGRIAVGRAQAQEERAPRLDAPAAQLEVPHGDPPRELHRAVVAQQLLYGVGVQGRVQAQAGELVGIAQQSSAGRLRFSPITRSR